MKNKIKATFFNDAGHGWLSVKRSLLKDLGILNKISGCSYQKGKSVYLEEDCDVNTLFEALKAKHGISNLNEFFNIKNSYKDSSPVRSYSNFNSNMIENWSVGLIIKLYGRQYTVESVDKKRIIVKDGNGSKFKLSTRNIGDAVVDLSA